jgi:16S rRNA (cytosine1402-N4)-methyltransferase
MDYHTPVMLDETLEGLNVQKGGNYIDCTLGDGGHALEIIKKGGVVLGVDVHDEALKRAKTRIEKEGFGAKLKTIRGNFRDIENLATQSGFSQVHGILYDLGYSQTQLEDESLGLSFLKDQPLDMRLDKDLGVTAGDLVNALPSRDLATIFSLYGGERYAKRFAGEIVKRRSMEKFRTTKDLADLIVGAAPPGYEHGRMHPATRVFQALRIVVNNELENLEISLPRAARMLLPGGRMVVISFHSLEDKLVKQFGQQARPTIKAVAKKPLVPGEEEIDKNYRSRSAKLRVFEKTAYA